MAKEQWGFNSLGALSKSQALDKAKIGILRRKWDEIEDIKEDIDEVDDKDMYKLKSELLASKDRALKGYKGPERSFFFAVFNSDIVIYMCVIIVRF